MKLKIVAGLALALLVSRFAAAQRPELLLSVAVSLSDVLQPLAQDYERQTGERIVLNVGASNLLARQIAAGARVDVFISADEAQMQVVSGFELPGTRVELLSNQLAVAVPVDRPNTIRSVEDLANAAVRRIAVGDPAAVPAGVYARLYLEKKGLWAQLQPKLVPAGSVRLALAAVEQGAADAAIVYRTDIRATKLAREAFVVPQGDGPRIVYPAAVMKSGANPRGARRLLAMLQGPEATAAFQRAGFIVRPAAR